MRVLIRDETSNAELLSSTDAASSCIGSGTGVLGAKISVGGITVVVNVGIVGPTRVTPTSVICASGTVSAPTCSTQASVTVTLPVSPVQWDWEIVGIGQHSTFQGPTLGCVMVNNGPLVNASLSGTVITFSGTSSDNSSGQCAPPSCGTVTSRYTYL